VNLAHWYHVYAAGDWTEPVSEQVDALLKADFTGPVYLGLVGQPFWRAAAVDAFSPLPDVKVAAEADEGYEQVTINALREWVQRNDGAVMYAHTKGSSDVTKFRADWRRSMCRRVVSDWRANLEALEDHDAVGCHWLTPEEFPGAIHTPFFGGNYWMARCDYLRKLPGCGPGDRMNAELWIGLAKPRALDLLPGWPNENLFKILRTEVYE
jgi:hypothetical protein